ncbi:hypothetical protein RJ640_007237 [Escallonia rubra]|uniref:HECT-type E3 ubiquitin transferase n=1 Tax=Escallonia rubra TaxID=112253 RepID=A0AA88R986_9ASTE|nr:hypothetical protein RJ640_007237 [Escallonia rubra]
MGNRGQKRAEVVEELPADKRACSSLEFKPSSSSSPEQNRMTSTTLTQEAQDGDMETSSSTSESQSEGEGERVSRGERDSGYGSCDSDEEDGRLNSLRDRQYQRSSSDRGRLERVLSSLTGEVEQSGQLAALTELCEVLSFSTEDSFSNRMTDTLTPVLVRLSGHESNPDIMLLAIRAITYLCDVHSRSSEYLLRYNAVTALCQRLLAIEYLDVAEQCLQALEKISREQPLHCLQSGAVMAVLTYIDFFSTSVQRVALSTVVNICMNLPSECPSSIMEAVPMLCNLLQYEDRQLVENVATCLILIAERARRSSDMLDELCNHGLVHQATHLISLSSRTTLCQPVFTGLIGLLVKLASGSILACRTLFEHNISSILKDILSTCDLSHGMTSPPVVDGHHNQVHEVLKLLNELLPGVAKDKDTQLALDKEAFLVNRPDLLQKFGMDLLPVLIQFKQVVDSGVNVYVCYGCLSVVNKLVYFSQSDLLVELLKSINISSFLAGVFTRKDHHLLMLALQIVDNVLQKLCDVFLSSFVKEGVSFAVDALATPERCSQFMFSMFDGIQLSNDPSQKSAARDVLRCLCYAFDTGQSLSPSGSRDCKLEKDALHKFAIHIRTKYFASNMLDGEKGLTDVLQKLTTLSAALTDLVNISIEKDSSIQHDEEFYCLLHQIMSHLIEKDPISTFEFVESGIVKSLVNYLSSGQCVREKADTSGAFRQPHIVEKRFEVFGRLLLSSLGVPPEDPPLPALIRKLHSALSSVEIFSVVLDHEFKQKNSYVTVPYRHCTKNPCLKVQFVREDGEMCLNDYSSDVLTVDAFSNLDAIEAYLWPKLFRNSAKHVGKKEALPSRTPSSSPPCGSPDIMESGGVSPGVQELEVVLTLSLLQLLSIFSPNNTINCDFCWYLLLAHPPLKQAPKCLGAATSLGIKMVLIKCSDLSVVQDPVEQEQHASSEEDSSMSVEDPGCNNDYASPKLSFYLEGQKLDQGWTLYQAILQRKIKAGAEIITGSKLWAQVYKVTYRRYVKPKQSCLRYCHCLLEKTEKYCLDTPFFSDIFVSELASDVEMSSPTSDILYLLKSLEGMNRFRFQLMSRERTCAFATGKINNLDSLEVATSGVMQNEFVNSKLTEKLEQQMRDGLAVSIGGMPLWCSQLMTSCPFLFTFEARCKYFRLSALGQRQVQSHSSSNGNSGGQNSRSQNTGSLPRKKILVHRDRILKSAAKMMGLNDSQKVVLEVEYEEEVGTGLGPTLEFYTLVSHEFQKSGLGMWREDYFLSSTKTLEAEEFGMLVSPFGLFPRPWSSVVSKSGGIEFSEVIKKFFLLGQFMAKALQDGRVLDIPFSKAFYKVILGQVVTIYDIQSFDPGLGRAFLEFQALVKRKSYLESVCGEKSDIKLESCFRDSTIEDLSLDFVLPGYPDYVFASGPDANMVNMNNLEEYVTYVVDATINSGISRQVEAFKSGFNQVLPIRHLQIFTEEELERLLCGEREIWNANDLMDHIKFDHGYTASSPPVTNLLEIIREYDCELQKAFLRFVTGAPGLPFGGLASLNPKLTIVRKQSGNCPDADLPSVMTCANYLKLPPYSSKEMMKEKLLYAITEGQGSFHLS